jgi:tetratricopeptide (TPR) repeat protein
LFGQQDQPSDLESLVAAAKQAQAAKDYLAAAADYERAARLRPDIPELRANLGLMQHEAGEYEKAIHSFQEAIRLKPSLYVPNLFLGVDYVQTGKMKEAIPLLAKAEKMNATDPLPSLTLGRAYSALREYVPAIQAFRRAVRLDPGGSSAWFDLGIAQLDQVEGDARALAGAYPDTPYAKALFADSLVKQSRYREAATEYKSVLGAKDQPPCTESAVGLLYLRQGDPLSAEAQFKAERSLHPECSFALIGDARLRIDAGDSQGALQLIQEAWTKDHGFLKANASILFDALSPEHSQDFLSYLAQQRSSGSIEEQLYIVLTQPPKEAIGIDDGESTAQNLHLPPSTQAQRDRGRQEYMAGHYERCANILKPTLAGGDATAVEILAACSFFTGEYTLTADAAHALQSFRSYPPAKALYWSISANEKLASDSLDRFQELQPNSARTHILLGDMYRQRLRYDDAEREYAKALEIVPDDTAALLGLASAYYADGNYDKTIEVAQKALLGSPNDPEINLVMGEAMLSRHKAAEAEPFLLKSLSAKPQMLPYVHALLGEVYAQEGKDQEALRELTLGAESDQDGRIHYQMARLYKKMGDGANAAMAIKQTKALEQKRREGATVAVEDAHPSSPNDMP